MDFGILFDWIDPQRRYLGGCLDYCLDKNQTTAFVTNQLFSLTGGTMDTLIFYASTLIYPILTGPMAALTLARIVLSGIRNRLWLFWGILILVNILGFFFLATFQSDALISPGFFSCLITPIFAVLSALLLRLRSQPWLQDNPDDVGARRALLLGTIFIPLLQLITIFLLALLGPLFCELGISKCWES